MRWNCSVKRRDAKRCRKVSCWREREAQSWKKEDGRCSDLWLHRTQHPVANSQPFRGPRQHCCILTFCFVPHWLQNTMAIVRSFVDGLNFSSAGRSLFFVVCTTLQLTVQTDGHGIRFLYLRGRFRRSLDEGLWRFKGHFGHEFRPVLLQHDIWLFDDHEEESFDSQVVKHEAHGVLCKGFLLPFPLLSSPLAAVFTAVHPATAPSFPSFGGLYRRPATKFLSTF
jgi:hypothetical protein